MIVQKKIDFGQELIQHSIVETTEQLTAFDGRKIRVTSWAPPQASSGTVLLLQGRREFIEKYHETALELFGRGFAVVTLDWRGQGLSDRLLDDPQRGHIQDFSDFITDLDQVMDWLRPNIKAPVTLLAHSMGGHIAARYLAEHQPDIARAIFLAPMIGIGFGPLPEWGAALIARLASFVGGRGAYALFQGPYSEERRRAEGGLLSSDKDRLEEEIQACRTNPALALGGVTYGWIAAALASVKKLRAAGMAEAIRCPTLFVLAGRDRVVSNEQIRRFAARVSGAEIIEIADAQHEILKERSELRQEFWEAFDAFVAATGQASA